MYKFPAVRAHVLGLNLSILLMKENIQLTRFENGLTILTDRMTEVRSATLGFFFRKGSRDEPNELNGISHYIEHTVFKGSKTRSALEIAIETDRLGGNLDAFTTHEETGFAIKVIDDQIVPAFDLLADLLANPRFDAQDLRREQRVIIEEIKMVDDTPEEYLGELFNLAMFPGHPLGLSISGTPKTVRTFNREVTENYHRAVFQPANLVITAAGNIRHDQIVDLAGKFFSAPKIKDRDAQNKAPVIAAPILIKKNRNLEQAHAVIATPFVGAVDERRYAADLLSSILGGGTSSRLWQTVREQRGLAYSVGASAIMFQDCGFFSIYAATSPNQTGEVLDIAIDEMRQLVRSGVTEEELQLAKDQAVASILLGLEDSSVRAGTLARLEMVYGRQIPLEETLTKLQAVTTDDIQDLAKEFFRTENVAFGALGDLNGFTVKRERLEIS
jgi:predicted Zn-dependent peptidase